MTARERAEKVHERLQAQWPKGTHEEAIVIIEKAISAAEDCCEAGAEGTAKKLVQHMAMNMERESALLYPNPAAILMDPYGLLDLIRSEGGFEPAMIDEWMVEAQKKHK